MADKIIGYTPKLIKKAIGKPCSMCNGYISESEANNSDFVYSQTRSKHDVFVHMHCWIKR